MATFCCSRIYKQFNFSAAELKYMSNKVTNIVNLIVRPIFYELSFFIMMILLIDYWGIYQMLCSLLSGNKIDCYSLCFLFFSVFFSYLFTILVYNSKLKILKLCFYFFAIFLFSVDIFHHFSFERLLRPVSIMLAMESNATEVSGFFNSYLITSSGLQTFFATLFLILICFVAEKSGNKVKYYLKKLPLIVKDVVRYSILIILVMGIFSFRCDIELFQSETLEEISSWDRDTLQSRDRISNLLFCFYEIKAHGKALVIAEGNTKIISSKSNKLCWSKDSTNVIFILGESYSKSHSNLYGYQNNTNPRLVNEQQKGNLFVYKNVISPNMHTLEALRNIFSLNSVGDGEQWYDYPFFPAIMHNAGCRVLFWDNQDDRDKWYPGDFTLNSYLHSPFISKLSYDAEHPFVSMCDGDLIDDFSKFWSKYNKGVNNFVMFHLQGQHLDPESHYPQKKVFQHFTLDSIKRNESWMSDKKRLDIAHYDNCTLYNDSVIAQIISLFKDDSSVLVYFPDHAENVYDIGDSKGRIKEDIYFYEIPFYIWCSEKYKEKHPEIVDRIRNSVNKPMMIDNVCHLMMHLSGVSSPYYKKNRDVLSPEYKCPPRIISGGENYDSLK